MKKTLIILAALAISNTIAYSQQHIVTYYDGFKKFKEEDYFLDAQAQKNGKYISYFKDGSLKQTATYTHGKLAGKCTTYYMDAFSRGIASIANFKDDEQDGLQQYYFDNDPEPIVAGHKPYVVVEELYQAGGLTWRKMYDFEKGKRFLAKEELIEQGIIKGYLSNGHQCYQIAGDGLNFQDGNSSVNKIRFTNKEGKKDGLYMEWYPNGQIADSCYYQMGNMEGMDIAHSETGATLPPVFYISGHPFSPIDSSKTLSDSFGHFKMYNMSGELAIEGTRENGMLVGEYKIYYSDGNLFQSKYYAANSLDGSCKTWILIHREMRDDYNIISVLKSEQLYSTNKLQGVSKEWEYRYNDGKYLNLLKSEISYYDGKVNGDVITYDNDCGTDVKLVYRHNKLAERWVRPACPNHNAEWRGKSLDDAYYLK